MTRDEIKRLCTAVQADITDEMRSDPDAEEPSICLTVGAKGAGPDDSWSYQTGDNSFTGGAYGYPHWAVVYLDRDTDIDELVEEVFDQIEEHVAQSEEEG